jgi:predicted PurR-regulated permease PerM
MMKDNVAILSLMLIALLGGYMMKDHPAFAQNMSQMGRAPWTKRADRAHQLGECMKLVDDIDRQRCVEKIK